MILKIKKVAERESIAGILVKNGYMVKQIKQPSATGKSIDVCLEIIEPDNPVASCERGNDE